MTPLQYQLDRIISIDAPRDLVFRYFTTSERWAAWWGKGSEIDPRPGGRMRIVHPNGIEFGGEILEVDAPRRIVFTYGNASGTPIPLGGSRVSIVLDDVNGATRLHLTHDFAEQTSRDQHEQGWRYQLSLFANVVADELHQGAAALVDGWFAMWADPDAARRAERLAQLASPAISFRDRFSRLSGADDVLAHIAAAQIHMPGVRLERDGDVRHCQGVVLANWRAVGADGAPRGNGVDVFMLGADRRITAAVGFWG